MPPLAEDTAWILKPGAKPFEFFDAVGTLRRLLAFFNTETRKEIVQCNQCGVHVNSAHLASHQQATICIQKARSNARMQNQNAELKKLTETVRILTKKSPSIHPGHLFAPPPGGPKASIQGQCVILYSVYNNVGS